MESEAKSLVKHLPKTRIRITRKTIERMVIGLADERKSANRPRVIDLFTDTHTARRIERVVKPPNVRLLPREKTVLGFVYFDFTLEDGTRACVVTDSWFDDIRRARRKRGWRKSTLGMALDYSDLTKDFKPKHPNRHRIVYFLQ
jgi:hypothetical protein